MLEFKFHNLLDVVDSVGLIGRQNLVPGAHQGQFPVYLEKYQKFRFVFLVDVLTGSQGLQQFGILLFPDFG